MHRISARKTALKLLALVILLLLTPAVSGARDPSSPSPRSDAAGPVNGDGTVGPRFTIPEARFIREHPRIRIGLIPGFEPYMFLHEDGTFQSIIPDYLRLIEERTGIAFESVPLDLSKLHDAIGAGIDLFPGLESPERRKRMRFTDAFLSDPWVIVDRAGDPLIKGVRDLKSRTVSVVENIYIHQRLVVDYPEIRILPLKNHLQALRAVSMNRAHAYIGPLSVAGYLISHHRLTNLKIAAPAGYPAAEVKFGVRKDWPELVEILDKTISTVTRREVDALFQKWTPVRYESGVDWILARRWIAGITGVFGILLASSLWWNRKLAAEIEERARAEEKLRKSRTILKKAEGLSAIGGYEYDIPSGRLAFSDGWMKIHGVAKRTLAVEDLLPIAVQEDHPKIRKAFDDALHNVEPYDIEHRIIRQNDGEVRVIKAAAEVIFDDAGRPVKMYGSVQDITERKRTESALAESEEKLRVIVNQSGDGIALVESDPIQLRFVNPALSDIFGYSSEELLAMGVEEFMGLFHPDHREKAAERMKNRFAGRRVSNRFEYKIIHKNGETRWIELYADTVKIGGKRAVLSGIRDISDRKRAESRIKAYSDRLEELVEERTRELRKTQEELLVKERLAVLGNLAGSISHEIRNPLGAIESSAYFLDMKIGRTDAKIREHLHRIAANVEKANAIIESLLNLTRMEKPKTRAHSVSRLISAVLDAVRVPAAVRIAESYPDHEIFVDVDAEQIRMVFQNILQNAVQAMNGSGTIAVTAQPSGTDRVGIVISDTGPGIPPENLQKIFQPLFTTKVHGIGFGLSIARMIIEKHGGDMHAESSPGEGAAFTIVLPIHEERKNGNE